MSEPNLFAFLSAAAEVQPLCGDRIYPQVMPQQHQGGPPIMPCAVFSLVATEDQALFCATDSLAAASYQIDAYSPDRDQAVALARAIRRAMVDYSGLMGSARVSKVLRTAAFDVGPEVEPGLYRRSATYSVWYHED